MNEIKIVNISPFIRDNNSNIFSPSLPSPSISIPSISSSSLNSFENISLLQTSTSLEPSSTNPFNPPLNPLENSSNSSNNSNNSKECNSKENVIENVVNSLSSLGFVLITGHGISSELLQKVSQQSYLFYSQTNEQKKLFYSKDKARRGYSPIDSENFVSLAGERKPNDLVEKIRFGPELIIDNNDPYYHSNECKIHFMPNEWGELPETFRSTILEYNNAIQNLAIIILEILACGLNLPNDYFTTSMNHHTSILTLNHFPSLSSIPTIQPQQLRVAEHTDVSLITIVNQTQPFIDGNNCHSQGLEICTPNGDWISIPNIPDSLIINIGDCLQYWLSNILKSTRHRVSFPLKYKTSSLSRDSSEMNSKSEAGNDNEVDYDYELERYSIAYFVSPNYDTILRQAHHYQNNQYQELKEGGESKTNRNQENVKDLTYSEWRKERIKQAMKSLKKQK